MPQASKHASPLTCFSLGEPSYCAPAWYFRATVITVRKM
jgi:hypothetical protein